MPQSTQCPTVSGSLISLKQFDAPNLEPPSSSSHYDAIEPAAAVNENYLTSTPKISCRAKRAGKGIRKRCHITPDSLSMYHSQREAKALFEGGVALRPLVASCFQREILASTRRHVDVYENFLQKKSIYNLTVCFIPKQYARKDLSGGRNRVKRVIHSACNPVVKQEACQREIS